MHNSVKNKFLEFNRPIEGRVKYMYLDIAGWVTIGVGNLIDPVTEALDLPFKHKLKPGYAKSGQFATQAEIRAEWNLISSKHELAKKGYKACAALTNLELDDDAIDDLVMEKLRESEIDLKMQKPFKDFEQWPADAQLGLLSMAWAMGADALKKWPRFRACCERTDFTAAAQHCHINEAGNAGVAPRNVANKRLFKNAAAVLAGESSGFTQRAVLYYPTILMKPITITSAA